MADPTFTGIPELDEEILLSFDYQTLSAMCAANDLFWKKKLRQDFSEELLKYKPLNQPYQKK
jgi:hypothetical protein